MKRCIVLFMLICVFMGCGASSSELIEVEKEYQSVVQLDLSEQELIIAVTDFELNNPSHFDSKLDLGHYYMSMGDDEKAMDYFKRAEGVVKNAPQTDEGQKFVSVLYEFVAEIEFSKKSFAEAEIYAKKSIDAHSEGENQYYLLGQSQLAQGKTEDALKTFDLAFSTVPEKASPDDLREYMYLLANSGRFTECVPILERYFETGKYILGLALFASTVYENVGETEKFILSALLDYEIIFTYAEYEHNELLNDLMSILDELETALHSMGEDAIGVPVLQLIRSQYDKDIIVEDTFSSFFIARYYVLTRKIMDNTVTVEDYKEYLSLEKYYKMFPVYHWNVWTMSKMLAPSGVPENTLALETFIALQPGEFSVNKAKYELGALIGLDKDTSKHILTGFELRLIVSEYGKTGNPTLFDKIYALLELPDNSYVTHAMEYLKYLIEYSKDNKQEYTLEDILSAKLQTADGLLKERLEYILH